MSRRRAALSPDLTEHRFDKPGLILAEGPDERSFFTAVLRLLGLDSKIDVFDVNGKSRWRAKVMAVSVNPYFKENVKALGLVRDADDNPDGAKQSCSDALKAIGFPVPNAVATPQVDGPLASSVLVVPDCQSEGTLETLCLRAVDAPRMGMVESYLDSVSELGTDVKRDKNRIKTFTAGLPGLPPTLHVAVEQGALPHDSEEFAEVHSFVGGLGQHLQ